jgi:hypothetical protein
MFAAFTAAYPVFIYDKYLESNLQEGIVRDPFNRWRQMAQQEIDREYALRAAETREDSYSLPVPPKGETNAHGTREEVEAKNSISSDILKKVIAQDKFVVREWEVHLQGAIWYVSGSRYIQYGKGVFKFIMAVLFLYCDEEKYGKLLAAVLLIGLLPFALAQCLQLVIVLGTTENMCITDEELLRELDWVVRCGRAVLRCLPACCSCIIPKGKSIEDKSINESGGGGKGIELQSLEAGGEGGERSGAEHVAHPLAAELASMAAAAELSEEAPIRPPVQAKRGAPDSTHSLAATHNQRSAVDATLPTPDTADLATSDLRVSLSRSRTMALHFEEVAAKAAQDKSSTGAATADVSAEEAGPAHRVPAKAKTTVDFSAAIEKAKQRADLEYSL